ncbi:MAG: GIY-YIG nuclease family protein [bacterium]|uniref:GIY-YIG nuclease family protein n=1 Tax=Candidatus Aphodosoma intestinipullorum TaxID=2840674 RepID=A0A940DKZ6_9BACT|nr:GIY-YIG nuclease family protein [Candidatus Aphodosoma intestinipullorum]
MQTPQRLKQLGFLGFNTVASLRKGTSVIPDVPCVYLVLYTSKSNPDFINPGTGGFFKGKNPNVSIEELQANWIDNEPIIYIGKATSLHRRIWLYIKFGNGHPVGHYGGRYIWQIKDSGSLIICWKPITDQDPADIESRLIQEFKAQHNGQRPFANLIG